jgi:hypothetical protein
MNLRNKQPGIRVFHTCAFIRDTAYIPFYHRCNIPSLPSGYSIHVLLSEIQHTFPSIIGTTYLPFLQGIPKSIHALLSKIKHTFPSIIGIAYLPFHQGIPHMRLHMHMRFYQRYSIDGLVIKIKWGPRNPGSYPFKIVGSPRALGLISQTEEGYKA